jgi:hypothetical protein
MGYQKVVFLKNNHFLANLLWYLDLYSGMSAQNNQRVVYVFSRTSLLTPGFDARHVEDGRKEPTLFLEDQQI